MSDIQRAPEHVNPVAKAIKEHAAATGDIYVTKNPGHYAELYRLDGRDDKYPDCFRVTRLDPLTGEAVKEDDGYARDRISEDSLRQYYRYLSHDLAETMSLARKVMDGDTIDLCGLLFLVRSGTPARYIQAKTLLTDNATMPLSGVTIDDGDDDITFAVTVGKGSHVAGRIRKDESRTPEYLDIDIPGFATNATLVEYSRRVSLNH